MRFNCSVKSSDFPRADGALEFENGEFVVFKKGTAAKVAFGALGSALSSGKEALRFSVPDLKSYALTEKTFKNILRLDLVDGRYVELSFGGDEKRELLLAALAGVPRQD